MTELYMFYKLIHNFFMTICLLILTSNQAFADNSVKDFFYNKIPIISDLIFEKYTVEELGYLDDFGQSLNEINNLSVPLYKELNVKKSFEDISNDLNEKEILEQKEEEINRYITKMNIPGASPLPSVAFRVPRKRGITSLHSHTSWLASFNSA